MVCQLLYVPITCCSDAVGCILWGGAAPVVASQHKLFASNQHAVSACDYMDNTTHVCMAVAAQLCPKPVHIILAQQ